MKAKQGFKLPRKLIVKRLKAYQRKPWAFSPGKLIRAKSYKDFAEKIGSWHPIKSRLLRMKI